MTKKAQAQPYDYLIIGQGLAGSLLAWRLWLGGAKILVVDTGNGNASRVAAGLVSPVTGKRWVKMAGIEQLLSNARKTYAQLETEMKVKLLHDHPLLRLYCNAKERALAGRRTKNPAYQAFLGHEMPPGGAGFGLADDFGSRWILQAAHLATRPLLDHLRDWLEDKHAYRIMRVNHAELEINASGIRCSGIQADNVIFCEGWRVIDNPWFSKLPWQPSQGEILTLTSPEPLPPFPLNRGIWLLPEGENRFRIGATYRWHPLQQHPTTGGVAHLLAAFRRLFRTPPRVRCIDEDAGVRPNTLDHQPILGRHPRLPQLILCNGYGSRGSLYAPWCSQLLADHLLNGAPLPANISIERYHAYLID